MLVFPITSYHLSSYFARKTLTAERLLHPVHGTAADSAALQEVHIRYDMAAQYQPDIRRRIILADAHAACLAALLLRLTRPVDTGAQSRACGIETSGCHRHPFAKTGFSSRSRCYSAYDLMT